MHSLDGSEYKDCTSCVETFDPRCGSWDELADLPIQIWGGTAATTETGCIVMGGSHDGESLRSVYEFDTRINAWIQRPPLKFGRWCASSCCF